MGRIKRILRLCRFEFFDKGEGRHKRIQAVNPSFGKGRRETQKEFRQLVIAEFFLAKEEERKIYSMISIERILYFQDIIKYIYFLFNTFFIMYYLQKFIEI